MCATTPTAAVSLEGVPHTFFLAPGLCRLPPEISKFPLLNLQVLVQGYLPGAGTYQESVSARACLKPDGGGKLHFPAFC